MGRPPRLISATSSPSRKTRVRKPSHFGSYSQPSPFGIPASEIAESIGSMSGGSGSFKVFVPSCLYLVDSVRGWYYIGGRTGPLNSTSRPHPSLGKLAQAGFPLFRHQMLAEAGFSLLFPESVEQIADGDLAVFLGQGLLGGQPDPPRRDRAACLKVGEAQCVVDLDVGDAAELVGQPLRPLLEVAVAGSDLGDGGRDLGFDLGFDHGAGLLGSLLHLLCIRLGLRCGLGFGLVGLCLCPVLRLGDTRLHSCQAFARYLADPVHG